MPFCGECGHKLNDDAMFCGNCGAKTDIPAPAPTHAPAPTPASASVEVVQVVEVKEVAPAATQKLAPGEELVYTPQAKGGDFASPSMNRLLGNLPEPEPVKTDFKNYLSDSSYSIKAANNGITRHVTNKLWTAQITGDANAYAINKVYQYLAPVSAQEVYHAFFTDCEKNGYALMNASKRLETTQAWFAPSSKEALEDIMKNGFKNINTLAFTYCPVQCCKEAVGGTNTLVQCRVLKVNHEEKHGKVFVKNAKGILMGFIVEYAKK